MSEHPLLVLALHTRTRPIGTLNLAVALRGRSTGWGRGGRPRRTFVGRAPLGSPDTGHHFIELVLRRGHVTAWSRRFDLDGGQR